MNEVYVYNPSKKTVLSFEKKEDAELYVKLDPKQFGSKDEYKRKLITESEKDLLLKEGKAIVYKMGENYVKLVDKLIEYTDKSSNYFIRFKREGLGSVGVVVELNQQQYGELKSIAAETLEKHTVALNRDKTEDMRTVVVAKLSGNSIPQKDDLKMDSLMKRINVAMKLDNFKKLNPDYNKFAILTDMKEKESQIFRFPSQKSRSEFIENMKKTIGSKDDYQVSQIGNFNSITTYKVCKTGDYVNMYGKGKELKDCQTILNQHTSVIAKQKTAQTQQQTTAKPSQKLTQRRSIG